MELISFLEKENKNIISIGYCFHLIHLASEKATATFPVKVGEAIIDILILEKKR